ncbi:MAG: radical SAM protein [Endomicrobiales bacterium]|nr:radical SAM protein [Endomicrobiales bacterium]
MRDFPSLVSFTLTYDCNLKCGMCGQRELKRRPGGALDLHSWIRLVDEIAANGKAHLLLRGGEPFLFPGITRLISHVKSKGIKLSIDTNGMFLGKYAGFIAGSGVDNITVSIDGPERQHDKVRGVRGSFKKIVNGIKKVQMLEKMENKNSCLGAICFVISEDSYRGLSLMPDIARKLRIPAIAVAPQYYVTDKDGVKYDKIVKAMTGRPGKHWKGFLRDKTGVDPAALNEEMDKFRRNLGGISLISFSDLSHDSLNAWFSPGSRSIGSAPCKNPWKLINIQPDGEADFCVDYADISVGSVRENTIKDVWNSLEADNFRKYISKKMLPVCSRCGARNI